MIKQLAANQRALEKELRQRVQAFFEANDEALESVSIDMKLTGAGQDNRIDILIKETDRSSAKHVTGHA